MPTSIEDVPPEIFKAISSYITPVDYLKFKLVSKSFAHWATLEFKWKEMTKDEVIQGQTSLEAGLPRTRRLKSFICTHCGRVKASRKFSDAQAIKTNFKRICVSCGITNRIYTVGQMPKINGQERIPCWRCRKAVPKYDKWEDALASGKHTLMMIIEHHYRPEGYINRYTTKDGRTLDTSHQLRALAFCGGCLNRMTGSSVEINPMISEQRDRKDRN